MRARLDVNGSLEYDLIWKHWDTESPQPICALRASARRISVNVCIGWPIEGWPKTPMASDGDGGVMEIRPGTLGKYKLRDFAQLAGWTTALKTAGWNTARATDGSNGGPNQANGALSADAALTGWKTAMKNDAIRRGSVQPGDKTLNNMVALVGYATPAKTDDQQGRMSREAALRNKSTFKSLSRDVLAIPGMILGSFLVPTGRRVVLAPEFSLWLMGFPEAWVKAAPGAKDWLEAQAALELECSKEAETLSSPSSPLNS